MRMNWKTTLGGILSSLGLLSQQMPTNPYLQIGGALLGSVGLLILGGSAADKPVSLADAEKAKLDAAAALIAADKLVETLKIDNTLTRKSSK